MSDPLADLLAAATKEWDAIPAGMFLHAEDNGVKPWPHHLADAIRAALADPNSGLSLSDLGATQTPPECTCRPAGKWLGASEHSEPCAIEQAEWWRIPEGGER